MDNGFRISSASVTDRGLSEKRPQNEDSFLEMNPCGLFAVADGVGGAQAGDVASQMAVEILGEAFANQSEGSDAEEIMRAAAERANAAIYQMALELPQLASMATTLVALHIADNIATIGNVGDSRLYRVDRDGELHRETDDHSMVADEVRAGRMTEEQAENHPSRNVISRALGAEPEVDIDIKTILIEPGTAFLICSDGITRHVNDAEIKGVLTFGGAPDDICEYLKGLCYERGAEDNLTAVVVKVKEPQDHVQESKPLSDHEPEEITVATARSPFDEILDESDQEELLELDTVRMPLPSDEDGYDDDSRETDEFPILDIEDEKDEGTAEPQALEEIEEDPPEIMRESDISMFGASETEHTEEKNGAINKIFSGVAMLLIGSLIGLGAYHLFLRPSSPPSTAGQLSEMRSANIPLSAFEDNRRNVDKDPLGYIAKFASSPQDCEDFYLLGRAYLLAGDYVKARTALTESRARLADADPVNAKILASDIAVALAVTNDTTIQTNLRKELEAASTR